MPNFMHYWSRHNAPRTVFITLDVVLIGVDGGDAWAELKMVAMVEETHCQNFRTTTQPSSTRHAWTKTFSAKRMDFLVELLTILPPAVMLGGIIAQFQFLMWDPAIIFMITTLLQHLNHAISHFDTGDLQNFCEWGVLQEKDAWSNYDRWGSLNS